jgi:hypothetical protein
VEKYYIEEFLKTGDEGFIKAIIGRKGHGACVEIIQENVTQAAQLAVKVINALNNNLDK